MTRQLVNKEPPPDPLERVIVLRTSNLRGPPGPQAPYPPLGARDGTLSAGPGFVGEVRSTQYTGTLTNVPPQGMRYGGLFQMSIQSGCWELSWLLQIFGGAVLTAACYLDSAFNPPPPTDIPGNLLGYNIATATVFTGIAAIPALPVTCAPTLYSTTTARFIVFAISAFSGTGTTVPSADYQFNGWARRVR